MSNHSHHDGTAPAQTGPEPAQFMSSIYALARVLAFICASFTALGSLVVLAISWKHGIHEEPAFIVKLALKVIAFSVVAIVIGFRLNRWDKSPSIRQMTGYCPPLSPSIRQKMGYYPFLLAAVLVMCAVLAFPHLDRYPRAEPDEVHHLVVARNLAEHGLYASGHPEAGLKVLDDNDSVGPPVILPVAGAFRAAGTGLIPARLVMALFFLAFCAAVYWFCVPLFGPYAAVLSVACVATSWGTIYLGRTLYGEVPALLFMLIGLCLWRRAINAQHIGLEVLTGLCFGCMVLCKPFMMNAAWAFLGAWIYDRFDSRAIRWRHVVVPAVASFGVLLAWWAVNRVYRAADADIAAGTLALYKHNLLFGVRSAPHALRWVLGQPVTFLVCVVAIVFFHLTSSERRDDPASVVLLLFVPFVAYWWVFFTPGNIPRYFWYFWALGGLFAGQALWIALLALRRGRTRTSRALGLAALGLIVLPALGRTYAQAERVAAWDEMRDERTLAQFVGQLPEDATVATTVWPLEGTLNFLAGRYVHRTKGIEEALARYDVVIGDAASPESSEKGPRAGRQFGKYCVFERKDRQEP